MNLRDSDNALLPLVRFANDQRPFLLFGEGSGTGYFARMYSAGVETFTLDALGKITNATWNGVKVDVAHGGTNATTAAAALTNLGAMATWVTAPANHTSTGTAGQIAYDNAGNLYVCVATNLWSKFAGNITF